jgi:hypothetical protein
MWALPPQPQPVSPGGDGGPEPFVSATPPPAPTPQLTPMRCTACPTHMVRSAKVGGGGWGVGGDGGDGPGPPAAHVCAVPQTPRWEHMLPHAPHGHARARHVWRLRCSGAVGNAPGAPRRPAGWRRTTYRCQAQRISPSKARLPTGRVQIDACACVSSGQEGRRRARRGGRGGWLRGAAAALDSGCASRFGCSTRGGGAPPRLALLHEPVRARLNPHCMGRVMAGQALPQSVRLGLAQPCPARPPNTRAACGLFTRKTRRWVVHPN